MWSSFRNCYFRSNTDNGWFANDTGTTQYAVNPLSGGAFWDNVAFYNCEFWGTVYTRATACVFSACLFGVDPKRASGYNSAAVVGLGSATFHGCYFEDQRSSAIQVSSVHRFTIRGCQFYDCASYNWGSIRASIYVVDGGSAVGSFDGVISGNVIQNPTRNAWQTGIAVARSGSGTSTPERINIHGNTIEGAQQGIFIQALKHGRIHGNIVVPGAGSSTGITIQNTSYNELNRVVGNDVQGSWTNAEYEQLAPTSQGNLVHALIYGTGSPESIYKGLIGFLYVASAGGVDSTLYYKASGVGTTGWSAVTKGAS